MNETNFQINNIAFDVLYCIANITFHSRFKNQLQYAVVQDSRKDNRQTSTSPNLVHLEFNVHLESARRWSKYIRSTSWLALATKSTAAWHSRYQLYFITDIVLASQDTSLTCCYVLQKSLQSASLNQLTIPPSAMKTTDHLFSSAVP